MLLLGCDDAAPLDKAPSNGGGGAGGEGMGGDGGEGGTNIGPIGPVYGHEESADDLARTAGWMDALVPAATRLRDLVIPGTHNTASFAITALSDVHESAPPEAALFPEIAAGWSVCQHLSIDAQLERGVRFLDIRVNEHEGQLMTLHGLISISYAEAMQQIAAWSSAHPREVLLINIGELPPASMYQALADATTSGLSGLLYDAPIDPATLTIGDVWQSGRSIIATVDSAQLASLSSALHAKDALHHGLWANSRDRDDLFSKNDTFLEQNQNEPRWLGIGFTFTPDQQTIVDGVAVMGAPGNLFDFERVIFDTPGAWMPDWIAGGLSLNVLTIDFVEWTGLVPWSLRQSTVAPASVAAIELFDDVLVSPRDETMGIGRVHSEDPAMRSLGDVVGDTPGVMVGDSSAVVPPIGFEPTWWSDTLTIWRPIAPRGYICLGSLVSQGPYAPPTDALRCVHESLVSEVSASELWSDGELTLYSGGVSFVAAVGSTVPLVYSLDRS